MRKSVIRSIQNKLWRTEGTIDVTVLGSLFADIIGEVHGNTGELSPAWNPRATKPVSR